MSPLVPIRPEYLSEYGQTEHACGNKTISAVLPFMGLLSHDITWVATEELPYNIHKWSLVHMGPAKIEILCG